MICTHSGGFASLALARGGDPLDPLGPHSSGQSVDDASLAHDPAVIDSAPLVTGSVSTGAVRLTPHDGLRNSWRSSFHGRVRSAPGGCELSGRIAVPQATAIFMTVWTAGVALFIGIAALGAFATLITGDWRTFAKPSSS